MIGLRNRIRFDSTPTHHPRIVIYDSTKQSWDRSVFERRLVERHEPLERFGGQFAQLVEFCQVLHVVHRDLLDGTDGPQSRVPACEFSVSSVLSCSFLGWELVDFGAF